MLNQTSYITDYTTYMKRGFERFEFYLDKLEVLLAQAAKQKDAAAYLYSNDARTVLFMLEGLSKLYAGIHNKKRFLKIKERFKLLEDMLGAVDAYDCFAKEFQNNDHIPVTVTAYFKTQTATKLSALNDTLQKERWLGKAPVRISKIRKKLRGADWKRDKDEVNGIADFYHESIEEIKVLGLESEKGFEELEEEVHELRRQLRWLSIYPRALQGVIQLTDNQPDDKQLERYLTPEIVNSPFNKMPDAGNNKHFLLLEKSNFLALSWLISALGRLKDNGLRYYALTEALEQTELMDKSVASRIAGELLGSGNETIDDILKKASDICRDFFEGKYLEGLVYSTSVISTT